MSIVHNILDLNINNQLEMNYPVWTD